jgi:hypothetical protein
VSVFDEIPHLKNCILELFVGGEIGSGSFRRTYEMLQEPDHVLKVQYGSGHHNAIEWETWQAAKETKWAKWFAPCVRIDSWGSSLVMRKARTFESEMEFLATIKRVPVFFHDVRWTNWGMLDGRPVCIDYGHTLLFNHGMDAATGRTKLTKPNRIP